MNDPVSNMGVSRFRIFTGDPLPRWLIRGFLLCFVVGMLLLGFLRDAVKDEALYLQETQLMYRYLQDGRWFGNEAVGLHGFLFKVPVALLFLITGPSVWVATLFNMLLAFLAAWVFYRILRRVFGEDEWAFYGTFLLLLSYHFLRLTPTYLREIPALLVLLVFLAALLRGCHHLLAAVLLMVLLDAKESVFFMVLPGYVAWLAVDGFLNRTRGLGRAAFSVSGRIVLALLPSLVYLGLMLGTGLVPLNVKVSYILGLNEGGWATFVRKNVHPDRGAVGIRGDDRRIFQIEEQLYGWTSSYTGIVTSTPEVVGTENWPVVKLEKPAVASVSPGGGYAHWTALPGVGRLRAGDTVIVRLWYRTETREAPRLLFFNRRVGSRTVLGQAEVKLEADGRWHPLEVPVPLREDARVYSSILWPEGRDATLWVAGCRADPGAASAPTAEESPVPADRIAAVPETGPGADVRVVGWPGRLRRFLIRGFNLIVLYIGKVFYSSSFSLMGVPRFLFFIALVMSFPLFRRWFRRGSGRHLLMILVFWSALLGYVFRWSLGRYLLPFVPLFILLLLFFLRDGVHRERFGRNVLIGVTAFVGLGMAFEDRFVAVKVVLNLLLLIGLWLIYLRRRRRSPRIRAQRLILVWLIGVVGGGVALATEVMLPGQIGRWMKFGTHSEYRTIAGLVGPRERIWINANVRLLRFYRREPFVSFTRDKPHFRLQKWVRKARLINEGRVPLTHHFSWRSGDDLAARLYAHGVEKMVLVVSALKAHRYRFYMQHRLPELEGYPFLNRERVVRLKNKSVFIYRVKSREET